LASTLQIKILQFRATHILVGRLKSLTKNHLISDLDILTSTLGVTYLKDDLCASIDENSFKLFTHNDPIRYHCLLTLANPVNVSSAPDGSNLQDKALPIFSFSYKANPPHHNGTSKRYTLQFLKDVSFDKLNSMDEALVFRGNFSEDPCLCSLLLHTLPQKLLQDENLNILIDSTVPIFESKDLMARDPENRRLFKEELYLVLRTKPSCVPPLPIPMNPNHIITTISGWTGLVGPSISSFETTSTSGTNLLVPYNSIPMPSTPDDTLLSALSTAQTLGIDLSLIKLAYISRGYLQIPSSRSEPDSLVIIFGDNNANNTAGWSSPTLPNPPIEDIKGMVSLRRLYELEARSTSPHILNQSAQTPPTNPTHLDRKTAAVMRNIKARNTKVFKSHERRIADLELKLKTLIEPKTPTSVTSNQGPLSDNQQKKKEKKKKAAGSQEE
jgi:hypothetical protein